MHIHADHFEFQQIKWMQKVDSWSPHLQHSLKLAVHPAILLISQIALLEHILSTELLE